MTDVAAGTPDPTPGERPTALPPAPEVAQVAAGEPDAAPAPAGGSPGTAANRKRRRGSRGGRNRTRPRPAGGGALAEGAEDVDGGDDGGPAEVAGFVVAGERGDAANQPEGAPAGGGTRPGAPVAEDGETRRPARPARPRLVRAGEPEELPDPPSEGKVQDPEAAERALVRRPRIGDTRPAPTAPPAPTTTSPETAAPAAPKKRKRTSRSGQRAGGSSAVVQAVIRDQPVALDEDVLERQKGRERKGRPVGRYLMCVHVSDRVTQVAVLEGRTLIEHYVARPADDVSQIHGNIYLGKVQNVLPGMEAAFVDIGTPKNAVLYRGDVQYDREDIVEGGDRKSEPRIEQLLRPKQSILCQVVKNPIGAKGARLTQEVSLPGRFVVLIPNTRTYGISKRLPDDERKRLRAALDKVKPEQHGVIVRTAAEGVNADELQRDLKRLLQQWNDIEELARRSQAPKLLYREPSMAVRVIREEFNKDYRGVVIDDRELYEDVKAYVESISPALADRVEYYDPVAEGLPLFERHHVHEQIHKALDRKVWLPSGGSLIIEHTEALTVIDVNTGRNVGSSNLEETVFANNLEAADEIARQLRLRDIGGIIVIDFIDMEVKDHRQKVMARFRDALARDKTRTQVFDISELGLVEMTRKRIGEGLLPAFSGLCPTCEGRGIVVDHGLIE